MLSTLPLEIAVILVEPQSPGNIGMVCRAMANFGATDLRLVNPCPHLHPEARKFAVGADHLLETARLFPDLATALCDLHVNIAATRRHGRLRGRLHDMAEVPALCGTLAPGSRVGLVFGREDAGLTSEEVAMCTYAAAVRTSKDVGSLNLAQAVLLFLHELTRSPSPQTPTERLVVKQGEIEPLFTQIEEVLTRIAFLNPRCPERIMSPLRRIFLRAQLSENELRLWRGIWSQLAWSIRDWRGRKRG